MLPVSEQYKFSPCEIKSISNDLILTGTISDITNDYLQIINEPDKLPIIHCNTVIKLNIYNNTLGFLVMIGTVYLSTPEFIRIVEVQNASDFEKRDFFRINVNLIADAYLVHDDLQENIPVQIFTIKISDLSLGGLFFRINQELQIDDHLVVNLNMDSGNMSLLCKIKRKVAALETSTGYGCEFIDNSGRQFDKLCRFIFDFQRQQIRELRQKHIPIA